METFKIYLNKKDYLIELEIVEDILRFQITDIQVPEDKYKNVFTYKKLIAKVEAISYFAKNIYDIKKELVETIKKSQYSFQKVDFFSLFTFQINKFPNEKKNFLLELFLYKTDSRQATLMITQLEEKVAKVIEENKELRSLHDLLDVEIASITSENKNIKQKIECIQKEIVDVINSKKTEIQNFTNEKIVNIGNKFSKIKEIINSSRSHARRSTTLDISQLPIIRPEDKKNLAKWFDLDFIMDKIYDSMMDGDNLESLRSKVLNKLQTLTVIELDSGRRFGAYISIPYFQQESNVESFLTDDPNAFIVSFDKRRKFAITNQKYVASFSLNGILIGSGPDIFISNEFSSNNKNFSNIKGSYGENEILDEGYNRNNYLAGIEFFKIKKIEIHQIIFK